MNEYGLTFHHFGLAVRAPGQAFSFLQALGYTLGPSMPDPLQRVALAMCHHPAMPDVEVIWPGDGPSPIDQMLKRGDGLIYHQCYVAEDAERALSMMRAAGVEVLTTVEPRPAILFGGSEVSFHYINGFGLIELIHGVPQDDGRGAQE